MGWTKVRVGQVWSHPAYQHSSFEIVKIDDQKMAWANEIDIFGSLVRRDIQFGPLLLDHHPDNWEVGWKCVKEVADLSTSSRIERPCRNKWCQRMNDLGAKMCWHCETENPTRG